MSTAEFKQDVTRVFKSVIEHGEFDCAEASDVHVRLESDKIVLQVVYDRHRSFELAVEVSRKFGVDDNPTIPYNLGEIFRYFGVPRADEQWFFQGMDYRAAIDFLDYVAQTLETHGSSLLKGEESTFNGLAKLRTAEAAAYTHSLNMASVRLEAEKAWHQKNYLEYVRLMKPYDEALSGSEKRKLAYATKQTTGENGVNS